MTITLLLCDAFTSVRLELVIKLRDRSKLEQFMLLHEFGVWCC
jgi:hypothetical protein